MKNIYTLVFCFFLASNLSAQDYNKNKFHQMDETWPTPNTYRTGSGSPGEDYWQQRADYVINVKLNDDKQSIEGDEEITYYNNSPHKLSYLWLQLDANIFAPNSESYLIETTDKLENMNFEGFEAFSRTKFDGGCKIKSITDKGGKPLAYTVNHTMMRIDLPEPLNAKSTYTFKISWSNLINNCKTHGGRGGYEYFENDKNYLYEISQWFPRMCVYHDVDGWQNKQYLGRGEFALEFGNYKVNITVPADHIVASTGVLQNEGDVLTTSQKNKLAEARKSDKPVIIVSQKEAEEAEKTKSTKTKTWKFHAENVRDFSWASSRKFIWDGMNANVGGKNILCMSYYPKEGNPLWEKYSTHAVAHTLKVYSRYTVNYPYPVAISVNGPVGGMEYPMICFNGPRPETDGTYSERTKNGLIDVVIHEVGHNFFPMIVSSDERQWTWMDEGLNTFCEYLTEKEWEENYPTRRGEPANIVAYMKSDKSTMEPIMSNAETIIQVGNNAYGKPATALNILRETIMGRELFDYAFKQYATKWAFKHPEPADLFRTMEDASGVDLDWFWKGWFYSTDACDIAIKNVTAYKLDSQNPEIEKVKDQEKKKSKPLSLSKQTDSKTIKKYKVQEFPELVDFYSTYDALDVTDYDKEKYKKYYDALNDKQKAQLNSGIFFYVADFENVGDLIMPIIVQMEYTDGTKEIVKIPAEIWRKNHKAVSKLFVTEKEVKQFIIDPFLETADIEINNNYFPGKIQENKFQLFKEEKRNTKNLMQQKKEGKL